MIHITETRVVEVFPTTEMYYDDINEVIKVNSDEVE